MSSGDEENARPGGLIFASVFLAAALFLLSQLGSQAKFSAKGQLFAEPAFWPAVGVIGMSLFAGLHCLGQFRQRGRFGGLREAGIWLKSLEYLIWFMVYVFAVPIIGYLPASLIFATLLAFRAGYRHRRMIGAAGLMALGVVLLFKTALSVKIPGGALYEYLPDTLRSIAMINF